MRARVQSILNLIVETEARFLSLRAPGTNTTCEKGRKAEFEAEEDEEVGRTSSIEKRHFC